MAQMTPKQIPESSRIFPNLPESFSRNSRNPFRGSGNGNDFRESLDPEEQEILDWLIKIESADDEIRAVMENVRSEPLARLYFTKRANGSLK